MCLSVDIEHILIDIMMKKDIIILLAFVLFQACVSKYEAQYIDNTCHTAEVYKYKLGQNSKPLLLKAQKRDSIFSYAIFGSNIKISKYSYSNTSDFIKFKQKFKELKERGIVPEIELDSSYYFSSQKFMGQTCYSFAVESMLRKHDINPSPFFDSETLISGEEYAKIMKRITSGMQSISPREFRKNKELLQDPCFIALQTKGMLTHGIYYQEGVYFSKNGYSQPAKFLRLPDIIKSYKYTDTIHIYPLDTKRLLSYLERVKE